MAKRRNEVTRLEIIEVVQKRLEAAGYNPLITPEVVSIAMDTIHELCSGFEDLPRQETVGEFEILPDTYTITYRGKPLDLTPKQYRFLAYFLHRPGKVIQHRRILRDIWGPAQATAMNVTYIRVLLAEITKRGLPRHLFVNVHGSGYMLDLGATNAEKSPAKETNQST